MIELLQVLTLMLVPVAYFLTIRTIIGRQNRIAEEADRCQRRTRITETSSPR